MTHSHTPRRLRRLGAPSLAVCLSATILASVAPASSSAVSAHAAGGPTLISSAKKGKLGTILVNSHGYTLYMFSRDPRGSSACSGSCAKKWVPLLGGSIAAKAGSGLNSRLVGKTRRSTGAFQATYNHHPLYLYTGDRSASSTAGEGASQFGGRWYAVNTKGNDVPSSACNPVCGSY